MTKHTLLPIIVSLLALAFIDPFMYWMPSNSTWVLLGGLLLTASVYGFFILTEKAEDEREVLIRSYADRISCLIGMTLMILMLTYQLITAGHVHTEIVVILVIMVISKSLAHSYACRKQ